MVWMRRSLWQDGGGGGDDSTVSATEKAGDGVDPEKAQQEALEKQKAAQEKMQQEQAKIQALQTLLVQTKQTLANQSSGQGDSGTSPIADDSQTDDRSAHDDTAQSSGGASTGSSGGQSGSGGSAGGGSGGGDPAVHHAIVTSLTALIDTSTSSQEMLTGIHRMLSRHESFAGRDAMMESLLSIDNQLHKEIMMQDLDRKTIEEQTIAIEGLRKDMKSFAESIIPAIERQKTFEGIKEKIDRPTDVLAAGLVNLLQDRPDLFAELLHDTCVLLGEKHGIGQEDVIDLEEKITTLAQDITDNARSSGGGEGSIAAVISTTLFVSRNA